jgi:uncharacterized protein YndB with AHSA1/START domain
MTHEPIVIERTYNAPITKVWQALTDVEQMRQWYFDIPGFKAEPGAEFSFVGKDGENREWIHLCKITEVIPLEKLSHTWRYEGCEGDTLVTWQLFEEGAGTRVRLTHSGIETFPPLPSLQRRNFEEGWTYITGTSLTNFLSSQ